MTAFRAATAQPNDIVVSLRDASKSFGSVDALKGVSLDIRGGEVHILLGENGAGKSTLVNVILGAVTLDRGLIEINGHRTAHQTPAQAREQGINAVLQDFSLAPSLKVYENLFLGREITQGVDIAAQAAAVAVRNMHLEGKIKVMAFDIIPPVYQDIEEGATVGSPTDFTVIQGRMAVDMAVRLLEKDKLTAKRSGPIPKMVTKDNIKSIPWTDMFAPKDFPATYTVTAQ